MLVLAQVSSMKTSRRGSRRPWYFFHCARRRAISGRRCSLGRTVFFKAQSLGMDEVPDRSVVDLRAALGKLGLKAAQGNMLAPAEPLQKPCSVRPKQRRSRPTDTPARSSAPRCPVALRPLHHAGHADVQNGSNRTNALAGHDARHSSFAKIKRIGLRHKMLASTPASILNQKYKALGIRLRFNPRSCRSRINSIRPCVSSTSRGLSPSCPCLGRIIVRARLDARHRCPQ